MNVLIIDDEKISRKVLLRQMEGIGNCTAVSSSRKGLDLVLKALEKQEPYDLITMDVSMPKMDGRLLLRRIRAKEKELEIKKPDRMKIIMVTSRMNISTIKECIRLGCNGYLSKPVSRYKLLESLAKLEFKNLPKISTEAGRAKSIVSRIIKRFYAGKIKLPVLPGMAREVQKLAEKRNTDMDDVANLILKDIVISSKLISIANSSLYSGLEKADSLGAALVRLGLKAVSGVVFTMTTREMFTSENKGLNSLLEELWKHSFACACLGKRIAEEIKIENSDALFLMGIVHDIGKMLLIRAIYDMNPEELFDEDIQVAIHEVHTTFGAVLLKRMHFPKEFVAIAEFHHWNDFSPQDDPELMVVNLADELANRMGYVSFMEKEEGAAAGDDEKSLHLSHLKAVRLLEIEEDRLKDMVLETRKTIEETVKMF